MTLAKVRFPDKLRITGVLLASAVGCSAAHDSVEPTLHRPASPDSQAADLTPAADDPRAGALGENGLERPDSSPEQPTPPVTPPSEESSLVVSSTGPGDWGPGDHPPALEAQEYLEIDGVAGQDGLARQYKVHVPASYDPQVPMPLVFCFHGLGQNAVSFCVQGSGMVGAADELGYILVMPNGFENSWNAGTCCGGASGRGLDDVGLVRALAQEVGAHVNVDLDRIYATGFSNGGYLSLRLACEAADLVAAVASGSGAIGINENGGGTNSASDFVACSPSERVSVLELHGTQDALVPFRLHEPALAHFARSNGCEAMTTPAASPASSGDTSCVTYPTCPPGTEVTGCTVTGGGHVWFGDPSCGTGVGAIGCLFVGANSESLTNTSAIFDFFERHADSLVRAGGEQ